MKRSNPLLQSEMEIGVFHREVCLLLPNAIVLEFGIKIGVEAEFVVKKFLVAKQGHIGPYCFQEKGLTPTGMGTDEIRYEALFMSCSAARAQPSARMILVSVSITKGWISLVLPRSR